MAYEREGGGRVVDTCFIYMSKTKISYIHSFCWFVKFLNVDVGVF